MNYQPRPGRALPIISVLLVLLLLGAMVVVVVSEDQGRGEEAAVDTQAAAPSASQMPPSATVAPEITPSVTPDSATPDPSASAAPTPTHSPSGVVLPSPAPGANEPVAPNEFVITARAAQPGVVGVSNRIRWLNDAGAMDDIEQANGSGVVVSSEGYIITNAHVIEDANSLSIVLHDGTEIDAVLVGADVVTDIAVLKVDVKDLTPIKIGNSDVVQAGDYAIAIGNPMGNSLFGTVTMGIVSAPKRVLDIANRRLELIQTDAAINPGNSGGALINIRGELIGIATMKFTATYSGEAVERIGFAVPVNIAMSIAQELIDKGSIERPTLGISSEVLNEYKARYLELPIGILIKKVYYDSPAYHADLREGDVILSIDGEEIKKYEDLLSAIYASEFGDTLSFTVYRDGDELAVDVIMERYEFPQE